MSNHSRWQYVFVASLIAASAFLYGLHYLLFHDAHHIYMYLVGDLAFVPLEVLVVTVVIHGLLTSREKKAMLRKMNMVISVFFAEVGVGLMGKLAVFDSGSDGVREQLAGLANWTDKDFSTALRNLSEHATGIDARSGDLQDLNSFLGSRRQTILRLLENPNLLEHESFTDLLWAVSHLTDELAQRPHFQNLPESDFAHLSGDVQRAYVRMIEEWINYLRHLKSDYPYLFSLACRTSPFDPEADPVVQ